MAFCPARDQIEHLAILKSLTPQDSADGQGFTLTFASASAILDDCSIGDSIAVNGACLTVTAFGEEDGGWFKVGLAPETLKRTDLGELSPLPSSEANLPRR